MTDRPEMQGLGARAPDRPESEAAGPERIYLEPLPALDYAEGRVWCEDDVWPTDAADSRGSGVEYVRADLVDRLKAENERLADDVAGWKELAEARGEWIRARVAVWEAKAP